MDLGKKRGSSTSLHCDVEKNNFQPKNVKGYRTIEHYKINRFR